MIEAANEKWKRYYKAFIADRLDGDWKPLAAEWGTVTIEESLTMYSWHCRHHAAHIDNGRRGIKG